ncbi:hypothetical protein C8J56DRAFT_1033576, partial [Mycena floridula]
RVASHRQRRWPRRSHPGQDLLISQNPISTSRCSLYGEEATPSTNIKVHRRRTFQPRPGIFLELYGPRSNRRNIDLTAPSHQFFVGLRNPGTRHCSWFSASLYSPNTDVLDAQHAFTAVGDLDLIQIRQQLIIELLFYLPSELPLVHSTNTSHNVTA